MGGNRRSTVPGWPLSGPATIVCALLLLAGESFALGLRTRNPIRPLYDVQKEAGKKLQEAAVKRIDAVRETARTGVDAKVRESAGAEVAKKVGAVVARVASGALPTPQEIAEAETAARTVSDALSKEYLLMKLGKIRDAQMIKDLTKSVESIQDTTAKALDAYDEADAEVGRKEGQLQSTTSELWVTRGGLLCTFVGMLLAVAKAFGQSRYTKLERRKLRVEIAKMEHELEQAGGRIPRD